jgi:hypothetical protein
MQKNIARLSLVIGTTVMLSGCSLFHMSQQECMATNWEQVGFSDGLAGSLPRNLTGAVQDCAKFGIVVDQNLYHKGWESGVRRYCTYDQGLAVGSQAQEPKNICPSDLQERFMRGWQEGINRYCSDLGNAFALGKGGQAYPNVCSPYEHVDFKNQYDRGMNIFNHMQDLRGRMEDLHHQMREKADQYHFTSSHDDDYYSLGADTSPQAREALDLVNHMASERRDLRHELSYLENQT